MTSVSEVWGAKALVFFKSEDDIEMVAKRLSKILKLPDFDIEYDEYPPHDLIGMGGALGFQIWLNKTTEHNEYNYELEIQTGNCFDEIFNDRMHDISLWLAKYISTIGNFEIKPK